MADKTRTVHHPHVEGATREVPAGDVDRWKAAGWRLTEPKTEPKSEPKPERAADKK